VSIPNILTLKRVHSEQISLQSKYNDVSNLLHTNSALCYAIFAYANKVKINQRELDTISILLAKKGYFLASMCGFYHFKMDNSIISNFKLLLLIKFFTLYKVFKKMIKRSISKIKFIAK